MKKMQMKLLNNKIGLYFGSFNPITIGHLIVAKKAQEDMNLDEVWFVVSPQNPHKKNSRTLEDENQRLEMVNLAIKDEPRFKSCDVEFYLPRPSYTHYGLRILREQNPNTKFYIIAGSDTQRKIGHWVSYSEILEHHEIIVYPRSLSEKDKQWELKTEVQLKSIYLKNVPLFDISATYIREHIKNNMSIKYMVPDSVIQHIKKNKLFL
jgi:nicotinate-nucleotide adenylyltransferase